MGTGRLNISWRGIYAVSLYAALFYSLYCKGLYFAPSQTYVTTGLAIAGAVGLAFVLLKKKYQLPAHLGIFIMYVLYTWLTALWAAAPELAVSGAIIVTGTIYFALFVPTLSTRWRSFLLYLIPISGVLLYVFAMAAYFDWVSYLAVIQGKMMSSVFQYHNTFAAYELAGAVIVLFLAVRSNTWWLRWINVTVAAACLLGDELSYSRWAWMLTLVMLLLSIVLAWRTQVIRMYVIHLGTAGVVSFAAFTTAALAITRHSTMYFGVTIIALLLGGLLVSLLWSVYNRLSASMLKRAYFVSLVVLIVAAAVFFAWKEADRFTGVLNRVHSINFSDTSFTQRFWYYGNALSLWLNNPVFGAGFGTWTAKFQAYEQYPYFSTMTHSVIMDQIDSVGIIGFALWVAFIGVAIYAAFRRVRQQAEYKIESFAALLGAGALLLHAVFDFDFNFPVILFSFMMLISLAAGPAPLREEDAEKPSSWTVPAAWGQVVVGVLAGILGAGLTASQYLMKHAEATALPTNKESILKRAATFAPYDPTLKQELASTEFTLFYQLHESEYQTEALRNASAAARLATWDPTVQMQAATISYQLGDDTSAYESAKRAARDGKFNSSAQNTYMGIALWTAAKSYESDPQQSVSVFGDIIDLYQQMKSNQAYIKTLPADLPPEWQYAVDATSSLYAAAAKYGQGDYTGSQKLLQVVQKNKLDHNGQELYTILTYLDQARQSVHPMSLSEEVLSLDELGHKEYRLLMNVGRKL